MTQNKRQSTPGTYFGDLTAQTIITRLIAYILLLFFGYLMIFPFLYMLFTSFKTSDDVFRFPPQLFPYTQATTEFEEADLPLYDFTLDGQDVQLVSTGENARFGFFSTQEQINVDDPRSSSTSLEIPLDDALETDRVVTLQNSAGEDEEFPVYEVTIDGATQELLLAYRGSKTLFIDPNNPDIQTYAVERTANPIEYVEFQTENYNAFFDLNLDRSLVNTSLVTVLVVGGQLLTSIFGGYAFSRVQFRGRDTIFLAYLGSIMIPFVVLIIPIYRLMVILDWQNQIASLIVPWVFTAYGTFLLRQFFISIPKEIEEAALIDGASRFRILWQIFVPLSKPAIATLAIFSFLYAWNSFLWPLLIIGEGNEANHVLTLSLIRLSNVAADRPNIVLTGAAIAILPPMIIFVLAQKYFIEGVASSGLKG